jgi:hypothetical protein
MATRTYPQCRITRTNAVWVFVSCSDEARHLYDIVLAIHTLRVRGVSDASIFLFIDHPQHVAELAPYGITANIFSPSSLASELPKLQSEHAIVIVTGHGGPDGIGAAPNSIRPAPLMGAVRSISALKAGVIVLGQCDAGLFNYTDAYFPPELVLIGATNLNMSISFPTTLSQPIQAVPGPGQLSKWDANVFLMHLCEWLASPIDVDGDGKISAMDAYKFAGSTSNKSINAIKDTLYVQIDQQMRSLNNLLAADPATFPSPTVRQLRIEAQIKHVSRVMIGYHAHQEPWILNANFAREIEFAV